MTVRQQLQILRYIILIYLLIKISCWFSWIYSYIFNWWFVILPTLSLDGVWILMPQLIYHIYFIINLHSWSYGSWIFNYLCSQCLSPITLWVHILFRQGVLNTILCDKVINDLQQVSGFLWVLQFPPPIKLKYCWKCS
jgi:hypothetical protein